MTRPMGIMAAGFNYEDAVATPWTASIMKRASGLLRIPLRRYTRRA